LVCKKQILTQLVGWDLYQKLLPAIATKPKEHKLQTQHPHEPKKKKALISNTHMISHTYKKKKLLTATQTHFHYNPSLKPQPH